MELQLLKYIFQVIFFYHLKILNFIQLAYVVKNVSTCKFSKI